MMVLAAGVHVTGTWSITLDVLGGTGAVLKTARYSRESRYGTLLQLPYGTSCSDQATVRYRYGTVHLVTHPTSNTPNVRNVCHSATPANYGSIRLLIQP